MTKRTIALFGEAERGHFGQPHACASIEELADLLGNPPPDSHGIFMAIQALLSEYALLFFRVKEEGFSHKDYYKGLQILNEQANANLSVLALAVPGVGDAGLIEVSSSFCNHHDSILVITEGDLYDYLTCADFAA